MDQQHSGYLYICYVYMCYVYGQLFEIICKYGVTAGYDVHAYIYIIVAERYTY